jgi:hypothetical protein
MRCVCRKPHPAQGGTAGVRVRRAMIIMASASGTLVPAIARLVAAGEDTVRDVIHTFNAKGLAALGPRRAGGRPRLISDGDIEVIVTAARTRPEKPVQPFTRLQGGRKLRAEVAARPGKRPLSHIKVHAFPREQLHRTEQQLIVKERHAHHFPSRPHRLLRARSKGRGLVRIANCRRD